ncbi:MAG TPA: sulfatase [Acidobacteriota bacterium]|nr:sulfatase [Acidobacteriota bacterium]
MLRRYSVRALSSVLVLTAGCGAPDPVVFDFAANFELATVRPETRDISLGLPLARPLLLHGWDRDENWGGRGPFVWGLWPESALEFYTYEPRGTVITLRGRPSGPMDRSDSAVEVIVNGHHVSTFSLRPEFRHYRVRVPRPRLRMGRNVIHLRYSYAAEAFPLSHDRARPKLSVAWQQIDIGSGASFGAARADDQSLLIPFLTRVEYFVDVAPGAALLWDRASLWGVANGNGAHTLRIEVLYEDGSTPAQVAELTGSQLASPFELALDGQGLARVSFLALPTEQTSESASGLRIRRPVLAAPVAPAPPAPSGGEAELVAQPSGESGSPVAPRAALPAGLSAAMQASSVDGRLPNVLVYLVDTLRADHLGTYGYERPTSPFLDAMSTEAVVFDHPMAQSGWTRTSVASILTGLGARAHSVLDRDDSLSAEAVTMQKVLGQKGYETYAAVANINVTPKFGFDAGFDAMEFVPLLVPLSREQHIQAAGPSDRVNDLFFAWLETRQTDRPFFAYLHTMDPHHPYTPPEPYRSRFLADSPLARKADELVVPFLRQQLPGSSIEEELRVVTDLYDGEIAHNDAQFGLMLDRLRALGIYDSTVIVFLSDHGEEFRDHGGLGHGRTLYSEMIFVPLVIKFPGGWAAGTRVAAAVQHVDLLPTILDLVGEPLLSEHHGDSLVPLVLSAVDGTEAPRFAERRLLAHLDLDKWSVDSLLTRDHHLMEWRRGAPEVGGSTQLFRWRADAGELTDLFSESPAATGYLRLVLQGMIASRKPLLESEDVVIDEELARTLRALGYLQ